MSRKEVDWEKTRDKWAEIARRNEEVWGCVAEKTQRTFGEETEQSYQKLEDRDHRWGNQKQS